MISDQPLANPLLVSPETAADILEISRTQVYVMLASGELPSLKIGRLRRIPVRALEEWIQDRMSAQKAVSVTPTR